MKFISGHGSILLFALAAVLAPLEVAGAADMPPSAAKLVRDHALGADVVKGWEDEQRVPQALLEAALREGEIRVVGSWSDKGFRTFARPFLERYPSIKLSYARGTRFDRALKPRLRKEGQNATVALVAAGEFDAVIMASAFRIKQLRDKGAPVAFYCPEPIPVGPSRIVAFKGTRNEHAARLFINWFISKEGQIAQYYASYEEPVHRDLDRREFLLFPDAVLGKEVAPLRSDDVVDATTEKVVSYWNRMWAEQAGVKSPKTK